MNDLRVRCPFHEGDRTPSLFILLQDKNGLSAGFAKCFGCGWRGSYRQVEEALGYTLDIPLEIRSKMESRQSVRSTTTTLLRTAVAQGTSIMKRDLPFRFSQYLKSRGIGEVVQRYNAVYEKGKLNMPFFNPRGEFMGSIERGTGEQKFYKVNGSVKYPMGIEELEKSDFVYITEGQIDKMSLEEAGFKAVALGTVSNYKNVRFLKNLNICIAFDNDEAGKKATVMAKDYFREIGRSPNLYTLALPDGIKDINELLVKEGGQFVRDWVNSNTRRI